MTKQPMIKGYWVPLYYAISTHCFGSMAEKFPTVFTSCSIQKKTQINQIFYTNNILQRNHFKFLADTLYFPAHKYNTVLTALGEPSAKAHTVALSHLGMSWVHGNRQGSQVILDCITPSRFAIIFVAEKLSKYLLIYKEEQMQ